MGVPISAGAVAVSESYDHHATDVETYDGAEPAQEIEFKDFTPEWNP